MSSARSQVRHLVRGAAAIAIAAGIAGAAHAQSRCVVLDPELQGSYEGGCVDGKAEGRGTAKGIAAYTGEFHLGRKHGKGVKSWARGDRYAGAFVDDYMEGWGIYVWGANSLFAGDHYEGGMVKDKRNGLGVYVWGSGDSYAGPWKDDAVAGRATPMMTNRFRATNAHVEAMEKPGIHVCNESAIGASAASRVEGETQGVNKEARQLSVKITRVGASPTSIADSVVAVGNMVWDDPLNWLPCN
jgi:hypothetical protein